MRATQAHRGVACAEAAGRRRPAAGSRLPAHGGGVTVVMAELPKARVVEFLGAVPPGEIRCLLARIGLGGRGREADPDPVGLGVRGGGGRAGSASL